MKYVLEYNGIQHYKPIGFFGGEEQYKKQIQRDKELKEYCLKQNIKLITIPYNVKDKLECLMGQL
jgi:hypothetical protein